MCHLVDQYKNVFIAERKLLVPVHYDVDHKDVFSSVPIAIGACFIDVDDFELLYAWSYCSKKHPFVENWDPFLSESPELVLVALDFRKRLIDTCLFFWGQSGPN